MTNCQSFYFLCPLAIKRNGAHKIMKIYLQINIPLILKRQFSASFINVRKIWISCISTRLRYIKKLCVLIQPFLSIWSSRFVYYCHSFFVALMQKYWSLATGMFRTVLTSSPFLVIFEVLYDNLASLTVTYLIATIIFFRFVPLRNEGMWLIKVSVFPNL